jgi:hypothetical protein
MMRPVLIAVFAVLLPTAAAAQSFFDLYLAERGGAAPCYARILEENTSARRRQIPHIFVRRSAEDDLRPPRTFEVEFGFSVTGSDEQFAAEAACETVGRLARCTLADETGSFTLAPEAEAVKLTIGGRLVVQGQDGFSPNLADGGNDLVLILQPAPPESCGFEAAPAH